MSRVNGSVLLVGSIPGDNAGEVLRFCANELGYARETAQRHTSNFGIATECGFGRRPRETIPELMHIHRQAADLL